MSMRALSTLGLLATAAALGCAGDRGDEAAAQQQQAAAAPQVPQPDTTAARLWAHLEAAQYQRNWSLWPAKGRLYTGQEPHGMLLTTYLNPLALDAVTNKAGSLPAGAIVVKENYMPDSMLAAVTVMYKAAGYNPDHNNWFWMKRLADGTVEASGRVAMCQQCHGAQRANDYLFTGSLSGQ